MTEWILWLDQRQGSTMVLLTTVYVVATIWVCLLMRRSNRLSSEALQRSVDYQKEMTRPYVVFDFKFQNKIVNGEISNIGKRLAYDVRMASSPPLKRFLDQTPEGVACIFTENQILYLPPGKTISDSFGASPQFLEEIGETVFRVEISYRDSEGKEYSEETLLNPAFYRERITSEIRN